MIKNICKYSGIMVAMIFIFALSMVMVAAIPNKCIATNVQSSLQLLDAEGTYHKVELSDGNAGQLDNFTDRLMIADSLKSHDGSILKEAMVPSYARYWHGYQVFLKPLLIFVSLPAIRDLYSFIMLILILLTFWQLSIKYNLSVGILFGILLVGIRAYLFPLSMQYSNEFIIIFVSMIIFMNLNQNGNEKRIGSMFMIVGGLTSFVDLLTIPLASFGMLFSLYIFSDERKYGWQRIVHFIQNSVKMGGLWLIGFAGVWVSKWILASFVLKKNVVNDAINQLIFRTGEGSTGHVSRIGTVETNLQFMFSKTYVTLVLVTLILSVILWIVQKKWKIQDMRWELLVIAALPIVWYMVLSNHSQIHAWFTYRLLAVTVFAVGLMFISGYAGLGKGGSEQLSNN